MKAIAHIYAKQDGTFDIAAVPMRPQDLAQVLLALALAVLKTLDAPEGPRVELVESGIEGKPPTVTVSGEGVIHGPIEGIDGDGWRR